LVIAWVRSCPRGGRPDLAGQVLDRVRTPTLLIVGGDDTVVIELNERAFKHLAGPKALEIVPGASHLFPEPGALEAVIAFAAEWFGRHLVPAHRSRTHQELSGTSDSGGLRMRDQRRDSVTAPSLGGALGATCRLQLTIGSFLRPTLPAQRFG
jgi:hypothetical protein